ncbi:hypothetical protein HRbin15_01156 [bacterium HR15]|nr:hypothetical protein HRbin15_01156 [bacterium HR15]
MQLRDPNTPCLPQEARVASRAAWETFAKRLRMHVRFACGLLPALPPAPLQARCVPAYQGEGFRIERFALETLPDYYLTGSLFLPEKPAGKRAPAMLQPHGHFEKGRLNAPDILRAVALAQAGAWVLMYDMVGYNDHFQLSHHGEEPAEWHRWGFSRAGLQTWNSLCAFEWLARQPQVDAKRIGCSGISGGGTQTFLLAAVEPRLACAAPVKMVSTTMQGGCICENPPLLRLFACNPEIAALGAPRPMLLISDSGDWTADNPERVAPFLRKVYQLYGAQERFQHAHLAEGHQFGEGARAIYYRWAAEVLKLNHLPRDPNIEIDALLPALRVWSDELPRPQSVPAGAGVFERYKAAAQAGLQRWRRSRRFRQEAHDALLSMLGLPEPHASTRLHAIGGEQVLFISPKLAPMPEKRPPFYATYNLMPIAAAARDLLEQVQALQAAGSPVHLVADAAGAAVAGIVAALAQVPCQFEPPSEPVDLPGWERIGGFETLRTLLLRSR